MSREERAQVLRADWATIIPVVERILASRDALLAEQAATIARVEAERDSAQHHLAYHLNDFRPGADSAATGDLAVDMAHFAERMRSERDALRAALRPDPSEGS